MKKRIPDLQLYVIGSGNLYNRNTKDDSIIPTNKKYKELILKYLGDYQKEIGESIHFLGAMGEEKNKILSITKVGISNPSGKTETFGLTALEFQASGVPVVTKKCVGYLDTVCHSYSGYLFKTDNQLVNYVTKLLMNNELNKQMGTNAIKFSSKKFKIKETCNEWIALFDEIICAKEFKKETKIKNVFFQFKYLKIILRKINNLFNFNISITRFYLLNKMIIRKLLMNMRK